MPAMERLQIGPVRLEVERIPSPTGGALAPVVFLHEGLGSVAMWRDWPQRVCEATGREGVVDSRALLRTDHSVEVFAFTFG